VALSKKKKLIFTLVLFGIIVVVPLVLVEVLLNAIDKPKPATMGWRFSGFNSEKNQLGFRGQKIEYSDDDKVVVLLGDSQVEGWGSAYEWMPERRLQAYLQRLTGENVKVFTIGAAGYGYDQELLALKEYLEVHRADMVILWQTLVNDVWNNLFPTHQPWNGTPKPTYWIEDGELAGPTGQIGDPLMLSSSRIGTLIHRATGGKNTLDTQWSRNILPEPYTPMDSYEGEVRMEWQEAWDRKEMGFLVDNFDEDKNHFCLFLVPRSPRVSYGIELSRLLMSKMQKAVEKQNGAFVTFSASRFDEVVQGKPGEERVYQLNGKFYKTSLDQALKSLADINEGFEFLNLPVREKVWRMGPEDAHLNQHAVDLMMKDLAKAVQPILLK
tara:strand:- start:2712 stop:3860 length:1149 start_codon:yes stop_codon:yes gene_type:complete